MVVAASQSGHDFLPEKLGFLKGEWLGQNTEGYYKRICFTLLCLPGQFSQTQCGLETKKVNVLQWPSQDPWHCLNIAVNKQHSTKLNNLE